MTLHIADVSEFQAGVDWPAYGRTHAAVIVRAHSGYRPDHYWQPNRDGARANVGVRGWYQYLAKGVTPETQAHGFAATVGALQPGEFVAVDIEEGDGDQTGRAQTWLSVVDAALATRSWVYSGESFAVDHLQSLRPFGDRNLWVAAYRAAPPRLPYTLWQHTDHEKHIGVAGSCDCSIYAGTADQFAALVGPPAPAPAHPVPWTEDPDMQPVVDTKAAGFDGLTPNWEANEKGEMFAWNGARPLRNLADYAPNHPPIVAVTAHPSGDGVILFGDDRREDPAGSGRYVRSTYGITVGLNP